MPARYAPVPTARPAQDTDRELDDAFESDDETESTPLTQTFTPSQRPAPPPPIAIPGAYDFERDYDYDYPPPGSPPGPSLFALPNNIGNSNGQLPSSPVRPVRNRPSLFRRAVGALLPQHYVRVPTELSARTVGGGTENDGVFANVMAKPARAVAVADEEGNIHMVPEDVQKEQPPVRSSS